VTLEVSDEKVALAGERFPLSAQLVALCPHGVDRLILGRVKRGTVGHKGLWTGQVLAAISLMPSTSLTDIR
jgi:hypothetical protein